VNKASERRIFPTCLSVLGDDARECGARRTEDDDDDDDDHGEAKRRVRA